MGVDVEVDPREAVKRAMRDALPQVCPGRWSLASWVSVISLGLTVGGVVTAVLLHTFVTQAAFRGEVQTLRVQRTQAEGVSKLQEWRMRTVERKVDNMQAQQTRIDKNLEKLLGRFAIASEPVARIRALPLPPSE